MKFFLLWPLLAAILTACPSHTREKPLELEGEEEMRSQLDHPSFHGWALELGPEAAQLAARKQGKILHRAKTLRPDERALVARLIEGWDPATLSIDLTEKDGSALALNARASGRSTDRDQRVKRVRLKHTQNPSVWRGDYRGLFDVTITCLPVSGTCAPEQAAVIEIQSRLFLSNHKPESLGFVYGSETVQAALNGAPGQRFGQALPGRLTSVVTLDENVPANTILVLSLDGRAGTMVFHGESQGRQMVWSIEHTPMNWMLLNYNIAPEGGRYEAQNGWLKLPLSDSRDPRVISTVSVISARKLVSGEAP